MSDRHEPARLQGGRPDNGDHIGQLLRLSAPREPIPWERALRVRAAVQARWRRKTRARSQQITIGWSLGALATAALVFVAVRQTVRVTVESPPPVVATVVAVSGPVRLVPVSETGDVESAPARIGESVREGGRVVTTVGGGAALRLARGVAVRVDSRTRLQVASESTLVLDEGAIYIDSGAGAGAGAVEIRTKLGVARDIGTRFEVRLEREALRVRVRDGLVQLTRGRQSHDARRGDEVTLDGQGGVVRRTVPVHGADWAWVAALAPPFELDGRSLRDFLNWICEENGWQLRLADAASEQLLATTLHGSIERMTPEEALSAVLTTSGVEHRLHNGVLIIRLNSSDTRN